MNELIDQIRKAADAELYFLALAGALMLPDMCSALESIDGQATGKRYRAWFDNNVAPKHWNTWGDKPFLSGDSCWRFRCSLLHQGTTQHPQNQYSRIIFLEPGSQITMHMNVLDDVLNIDVSQFCREMIESALAWQTQHVKTEPYETNLKRFVTRYPEGLPPYIVGVPVIT